MPNWGAHDCMDRMCPECNPDPNLPEEPVIMAERYRTPVGTLAATVTTLGPSAVKVELPNPAGGSPLMATGRDEAAAVAALVAMLKARQLTGKLKLTRVEGLAPALATTPAPTTNAPALGGADAEIAPRQLLPREGRPPEMVCTFPLDVKRAPQFITHEGNRWSGCLTVRHQTAGETPYNGHAYVVTVPGTYGTYTQEGLSDSPCPSCGAFQWFYRKAGVTRCGACDHRVEHPGRAARCFKCNAAYTEYTWFDPSGCKNCCRSFVD